VVSGVGHLEVQGLGRGRPAGLLLSSLTDGTRPGDLPH